LFQQATETSGVLNPNPWYIYECIPFLKDIDGYEEGGRNNHNDILVSFIRQMNKKPIKIVEEFLQSQRSIFQESNCHNATNVKKVMFFYFDIFSTFHI